MKPLGQLISVILPTFNEAASLPQAIESARAGGPVEVIVVDGGSTDGTLTAARGGADQVVHSRRGRASQLNAGAGVANGSILLFLHADTTLAPGALAAVRRAMERPAVGGAFTLRIGEARGALKLISWGSNLRSRFLGLTYGDQALFVGREVFRSLGGFRSLPITEDADFVRRLQRAGRMELIDLPVRTSARRWRAHGIVRTTFANSCAVMLFKLGVPAPRIRRIYDGLLASGSWSVTGRAPRCQAAAGDQDEGCGDHQAAEQGLPAVVPELPVQEPRVDLDEHESRH
jgi:rSAM/selenodomain-associated transferase 2